MWLLCVLIYAILIMLEPIKAEKDYWEYQAETRDLGLTYNKKLDTMDKYNKKTN